MSTNKSQSPLDVETLAGLANRLFLGRPAGGADIQPAGTAEPAALDFHGPARSAPGGGASADSFSSPRFGVDTPGAPSAYAPLPPNQEGGPVQARLGVDGLPAESRTAPPSPLSASLGSLLPDGDVDPAVFGLPSLETLKSLVNAAVPEPAPASSSYYFLDHGRPKNPDPAAADSWTAPLAIPIPRPVHPPAAGPHASPEAGPRPSFDPYKVRHDFPILSEQVNGRPLVWLDNAATTQKPRSVIERLKRFYEHENSNVHRAAHTLAARSTDAYEGAREKVRRFLGAASAQEIVFIRGATEAINLVAQSWGRANVGPGDEIVLSHLEHHANIVPWQHLAAEKGARLKVIPVDDDGQIVLSEAARLIGPRTKLLAVTQVSNALGTITPVEALGALAHAAGAKVLVDGAQAVSHMRVNVQALDADFYVFSGHKVFGPTGIGVLYGKKALLDSMPPWQGGGNMIKDVTFERTEYHAAPGRFEAGTGNIADAVGLGAAIDYVEQLTMEAIGLYEHQLLLYATHHLERIPGLRLIGTAREKASVLSFVLDGHKTEDVGEALSREGIAVRSGHHCAQPILRRFGVESTVRPSLAFYNHCGDIDALTRVLRKLAATGGRS